MLNDLKERRSRALHQKPSQNPSRVFNDRIRRRLHVGDRGVGVGRQDDNDLQPGDDMNEATHAKTREKMKNTHPKLSSQRRVFSLKFILAVSLHLACPARPTIPPPTKHPEPALAGNKRRRD